MLEDWIELCKLFAAHAVEYLLVGGQAAPAAFEAVRFTDPKTLIMLGKDPFRVDMRLAAGLRLPWQRRSRPTNSSKTLSPL